MPDFRAMTAQEQLDQVNEAITAVLAGGQNYKIGSRSLTRADLGKLWDMQAALKAQVAADGGGPLLPGTFVAYFDGR